MFSIQADQVAAAEDPVVVSLFYCIRIDEITY